MNSTLSTNHDADTKGQISQSAADIYEEFFVPALFGEWGPRVADALALVPGNSALDVACGTGVLARAMVKNVMPGGMVVGLDCNEGMLSVAKRSDPSIDWRLGMVESMPFPAASFDAVGSQFGLMFFEDRQAALSEMYRVLRPGGTLVVAVWDRMENVIGYAAMTALLVRLFGEQVRAACDAPFNMGDRQVLGSQFADAGLNHAKIDTVAGEVRFPSIESWAYTDVKGWTLADALDDDQFELLLREAKVELKRFEKSDGTVAFPSSAHFVTVEKH